MRDCRYTSESGGERSKHDGVADKMTVAESTVAPSNNIGGLDLTPRPKSATTMLKDAQHEESPKVERMFYHR